jgi:hypothetical protein
LRASEPRAPRHVGWGIGLAILAAAALWGTIQLDLDASAPSSQRFALSPQECNTECQSRQTDCIDECDGNVACERRCVEAGFSCVQRCKRLGADAGVGGAGGRTGAGGRAGGGGTASGAGGVGPGGAPP